MRNLAAKVSADPWPEFKAWVTACYQAPSRAISRQLAAGIRADHADTLPSALACFEDDFEACIAHLRLPVTHRRFIRTTDEIDKQFLRQRAIYGERERPRGEARRVGCKRRQASYSFLAGLRRSRAWPFGGRGRQASTKCW